MRRLLAVGALAALSGCGAHLPLAAKAAKSAGRDAAVCAARGVADAVASLSPAVLDALAGDSPDWPAQLEKLEAHGAQALFCAVTHALYDALGGDLGGKELEAAVEVRLAAAGKALPAIPTPRRRVLARGLVYLRRH